MKVKNIIITIVLAFVLLLGGCQTVEPVILKVPSVTISESGLASWTKVANASYYKYKIDNGTEEQTRDLAVQLTDGQKISVKAVGDGEAFLDSVFCAAKTYTAPAGPVDPGDGGDDGPTATTLAKPVVTISKTGVASWAAVPNASSYTYKIGDGVEQSTNTLSVQLATGQEIVVKAVGNGTTYLTGEYSVVMRYNPSSGANGILSSFSVGDLDGNTVTHSVFSGFKITMVNVWGTFCGPCIGEMPDLGVLAGEMASKKVQIIGVVCDVLNNDGSVNLSQIAKAKGIVAQTQATYLHLVPNNDMAKLMNMSTSVPTTIFVDSNGVQIGKTYTGSRTKAAWKAIINQILADLPTE